MNSLVVKGTHTSQKNASEKSFPFLAARQLYTRPWSVGGCHWIWVGVTDFWHLRPFRHLIGVMYRQKEKTPKDNKDNKDNEYNEDIEDNKGKEDNKNNKNNEDKEDNEDNEDREDNKDNEDKKTKTKKRV